MTISIYEPSFMDAVQFTLVAEGVLSDNAHDAGGLTKYGVTHTTWDAYRAKSADKTLPLSVKDITKDQAIALYHSEFWHVPGIDTLPRELQGPAFDFQVNSGSHAISTLAAQLGVANLAGVVAKLKDVQAPGLRRIRNDYVTARVHFLLSLAQGNSNDVDFIVGWFNRVSKLYDFAY